MKILIKTIFAFLILSFFSCKDDEADSFLLRTEEIVSISSERAIVMGRILASRTVNIQDHGFHFSLDPSFPDPIVLSLGNTNRPGRFIGEQDGLLLGENYFVKSYAQSASGQTLFGEAIEFSTILPQLDTVEPYTQMPNEIITIFGRNFGDDAQVFFGEIPGEVIDVYFGFRIRVRVPFQEEGPEVPLRILTKGREIVSDRNFKYVTGKYTQINALPQENGFRENLYFQQEDRFFVGLGFTQLSQPISRIWEYDVHANNWNAHPLGDMVKKKAYFGLDGFFGGGYSDFSEGEENYNMAFGKFSNSEFTLLPSPPFKFANALVFDNEDFLYVIGGDLAVPSLVIRWNKATNLWELRPNLPIDVNRELVHFMYNGKFYIIKKNSTLYEYNPLTTEFKQVSNYPSPMIQGLSDFRGNAIVVGNKAYIGLYNNSRFLWELDLDSFEWARINDYPGEPRGLNSGWYFHEGHLYLLRSDVFRSRMEFWKLDPNGYH